MKTSFAIITSFTAVLLLLAGCHGSPRQERPPSPQTHPGSGGDRPDTKPDDWFEPQLSDAAWRFQSPSVRLSYHDEGTLVSTDGQTICFSDLDGAASVQFRTGTLRADSVCSGSTLTVNGRDMSLLEVKMRRRGNQSVWYSILAADSTHITLVAPV